MIFTSSLRRSLLETGPDRRPRVPLRAYGKLPIASEFIDVGCETPAVASWLRQWIIDGWNLLQQQGTDGRREIRAHRIAGTCQGGRVWVIAVIVPSHDRLSPQGHQRSHPFAIFVLLPMLRGGHARLYSVAGHVWPHLEALLDEVSRAADRADCAMRIRAGALPLAAAEEGPRVDCWPAIDAILLDTWLVHLPGESPATPPMGRAALASALAQHAAFLQRSRERVRPVWRLPLAEPPLSTDGQVCAWLAWLETNRQLRQPDFNILLSRPPAQGGTNAEECGSPAPRTNVDGKTPAVPGSIGELRVLSDALTPADFLLMSVDPRTVQGISPSLFATADEPATAAPLAEMLANCRTLADFARLRLPMK